MEIELDGCKVQIDEDDYAKVSSLKWYMDKRTNKSRGTFYFYHRFRGESDYPTTFIVALHRYIMGCTVNDGKTVDHINRDTLDNRKSNLRICTCEGNAQNHKLRRDSTTGYKGVSYWKRDNNYISQIGYKGKLIFLGYYDTAEEAHAAYCEASKKYHGEFGRTE